MEIKTQGEINNETCRLFEGVLNKDGMVKEEYQQVMGKRWIALDNDVKEAISLYLHLKNHNEVQNAEQYKGMPCCKICNKSAYQIMAEEFESLLTSATQKETN